MENEKRLNDVNALDERDIKIIIALAENRINVSDVSRIMFVHRNTVLYHIEKIKRVTGYDPLDFFGLCRLVKSVGMRADEVPTVDAVEVVHGRWESRTDVIGFARCSVCHDCNIYDDWPDGKKWNYCPNCGAKMDGGSHETN